ncbi:MAG: helix-turn-helix domain-containing protein [Bacteroidota bacterium]
MKKSVEQMKLILEEIKTIKNEENTKESINDTWIDGVAVQSALHISERTLYRHRKSGMLAYSRIRGKIYYKKADIKALLEKNYRIEKPKCTCPIH